VLPSGCGEPDYRGPNMVEKGSMNIQIWINLAVGLDKREAWFEEKNAICGRYIRF
jgi:hypothetical protein